MWPKGNTKPAKAEICIKKALVFCLFCFIIYKVYITFLCKYISLKRYLAIHSTIINIYLTFKNIKLLNKNGLILPLPHKKKNTKMIWYIILANEPAGVLSITSWLYREVSRGHSTYRKREGKTPYGLTSKEGLNVFLFKIRIGALVVAYV
jgi:hypothetical protein